MVLGNFQLVRLGVLSPSSLLSVFLSLGDGSIQREILSQIAGKLKAASKQLLQFITVSFEKSLIHLFSYKCFIDLKGPNL